MNLNFSKTLKKSLKDTIFSHVADQLPGTLSQDICHRLKPPLSHDIISSS